MKIILWDIETAPLVVTSWGLFKPRLSHENIIEGTSLICAAWKEYGKNKVHTVSIDPKDPRNDSTAVKKLRDALAEADVLVAHNGDKFDLRIFNARLAFHGYAPLPPVKTIDTLKVARKYFRFDANRLDYLGEFLGVGRKIPTTYGLWLKILFEKDRKALAQMVEYNAQDVLLLEQVYEKLRPHMTNHPNHRLTDGKGCPICGTTEAPQKRGFRLTRLGRSQAYQCKKCGGWSSGKPEKRTDIG